MTGVTNAELAAALQQVIAQVDAREDQLKAWQSGAADEGPYADGRFPIVNLLGEIGYFKSPARLAHEVGLLTSAADGALAQCLAAQATAQAAATLSETKANTASSAAATATTKANQADTFRQQAANSEANALVHRNNASTSATTATAAATTAEDAADVAVAAKDDAVIARNAAQAAAAAAATFNPADFYTKIVSDGRFVQLTNFNWSNLGGKPSTFAPSAHNHTIAEVTGLQTALDGKQAAGSYSVTGHGHVIADVSGLQTALDGKQAVGNYSLVGHGHVIADVSGLQTALDGKQAAGSYVTTTDFTWTNLSGKPATFTPSAHTHAISDVTGLQTALDGKQAAGSYAAAVHVHVIADVTGLQTALDGKAAASHTHTIAQITGLQTALDGKQASGNYSLVGHSHVIADITGLQAALDGKQAAGSYVTTTNFTWANLSGKPATFTPSAHTHVISDVSGLQSALDGKQAAGSYAPAVHAHDYLPLSGGIVGGTLEAGDFLVKYSSAATWASRIASPWEQPAEVLNMNENGFSAITFHVVNKYANLFGYDENNVLKTNNSIIWHSGNFNPDGKADLSHAHSIAHIAGLQSALDGKQAAGSYAAASHGHAIGDVTGLATELTSKITKRTGQVTLGVQQYGATAWAMDGVTGAGIGGWARHLSVKGGELDSHAGFFAVYGLDSQAAEVRIGVGNADNGYNQGNALRITSSEMSWNGATVWHGGNFSPGSKSDVGHVHTIANVTGLQEALNSKQANLGYTPLSNAGGAMYGTLSLFDAPIILANNGSLPYMDLQTTGVSGGRNYRIRSGIEGVANGGFSIRDLTSGTNVLSIDSSGAVYTGNAKLAQKSNFGYSTAYRTVVLGNEYLTTISLGYDPSTNASGSFNGNGEGREVLFRNGVSFITPNAANNGYHLALSLSDGAVYAPGSVLTPQINLGDTSKFIRGGAAGQTILGVGDVNSAFLQVGGSYYSIWNAGNFDPTTKSNVGHTHSQYATLFTDNNFARLFTTGVQVNGLEVFPSRWTNDFQSSSDFVNGTLVITDIPANIENGDSFEIEITGKSYTAAQPPFKVIAQGYIYANTFISTSGISYGGQFADSIKVMERDGVLCFWWPRISYWNSFRVSVVASMYPSNDTITRNRVTSIIDIAEPSVSKKVTISLHRSIMSDPGSWTHITRPYANLLNLFNNGGTGTRLQFADMNWSANILHNSGNLMFQTQGENTRMFIGNGVVGIGTGNTSDSALQVASAAGSTLRIGYNGSAENHYNATVHRIGDTAGNGIMYADTGVVFSYKDFYALSGNLFIRENPSGAGAGLRLHHNGGSGYVDFDGDLNFRTGDGGSGLASLSSGGAFTASDISSVGTVRAGSTSGIGFTIMNAGTTGNPGYLSWYHPNGTRLGYMGWSDGGSNIVYQAEAGWGFKFNSKVELGGTTFNAPSNVNIHGGVNQFYSYGNPQSDSGPSLQAYAANSSSGAWLAFHRPNLYAINMGLDSNNVFRIGGWSAPSNLFTLDMAGNLGIIGGLTTVGSSVFNGQVSTNSTLTAYGSASFGSTVDVSSGNLRINSGGGDSAMGAYISYRNNLGAERGWVGYGEGTSRMRVYNGIGDVLVQGNRTQIDSWGGLNTRISTTSGHLELGPLNSSWCHFNTDRPNFYFGQPVHFDGAPMRYNQGAVLHHGSSSLGSGVITVSTASPSGGSDGDIWIKVAS